MCRQKQYRQTALQKAGFLLSCFMFCSLHLRWSCRFQSYYVVILLCGPIGKCGAASFLEQTASIRRDSNDTVHLLETVVNGDCVRMSSITSGALS